LKAVVDRIENQTAVVLFGDEETAVNIPLVLLPEGTKEGSFLKVTIDLDLDGEEAQREKISSLLDRLKKKNGS
jgi:hypothetical protein